MFLLDEGLLLFVLPALLFAFWAQSRVRTTYERYLRMATAGRWRGADVARALLDRAGLSAVRVERFQGVLTDHYDPRAKTVRLSPQVYDGMSVAALGIAAHETGHAIQHADGYVALAIRSGLVPVARFGTSLAWPLFFIGLVFATPLLMDVGILLFVGAVVFQIVTLPVEFNASSRAIAMLEEGGYVRGRELDDTRKVLSAAALTYVAATAMAVAQLLRLLMLRNRRL